MDKDIKELERTLADRLDRIEKQRVKDAAEFEKKKREREKQLAVAIAAQQAEHDAKVATRVAAEKAQKEQWAAWEREQRKKREAEDQENLKAEAERQAKAEKLRELQEQLIRLEHAEEQRKKALEQALPPVIVQTEVLSGPDGLTPTTSEMSDHLKVLLRQDRDFNNG